MTDGCERCAAASCSTVHAWVPVRYVRRGPAYVASYVCGCCGHEWELSLSPLLFERRRLEVQRLLPGLDVAPLERAAERRDSRA